MGAQTTYGFQPAIGFAGSLDRNSPYRTLTMKSVDTASMPFGSAVCRDLTSPASDFSILQPAAESNLVRGIVLREDTYARTWVDADGTTQGQLDGTGLIPGTFMTIVTMGRMLVKCDSGCVPGDGLWVRAVAGAGEALGALENADDSTDMIDCTKFAQWETTAAADGLAWLSFDFTRSAA